MLKHVLSLSVLLVVLLGCDPSSPAEVGAAGPTGATGPRGPAGPAASVAFWTYGVSAPATIADPATDPLEVTAHCEQGDVVVSGQCYAYGGAEVFGGRPVLIGWECSYLPQAGDAYATAVCLHLEQR